MINIKSQILKCFSISVTIHLVGINIGINSTLVRLRPIMVLILHAAGTYFNSTLVRLRLANVGIGYHIKSNGSIQRYKEIVIPDVKVQSIRLWSKNELRAEDFSTTTELLVDNGKSLMGNNLLNIGDECIITNGIYPIKQIVRSISKRNSLFLKISVTVYLQ